MSSRALLMVLGVLLAVTAVVIVALVLSPLSGGGGHPSVSPVPVSS